MKRIKVGIKALLVLFVIIIPLSVYGTATTLVPNSFLKGNGWKDLSHSGKLGYGMGIVDGILFTSAWERGGNSLEWLRPCVVGMTDSQVFAIIQKYIDDNPGDWHDEMHTIVFRAFLDTCNNSPKKQIK